MVRVKKLICVCRGFLYRVVDLHGMGVTWLG
jgi:hypothetical protein